MSSCIKTCKRKLVKRVACHMAHRCRIFLGDTAFCRGFACHVMYTAPTDSNITLSQSKDFMCAGSAIMQTSVVIDLERMHQLPYKLIQFSPSVSNTMHSMYKQHVGRWGGGGTLKLLTYLTWQTTYTDIPMYTLTLMLIIMHAFKHWMTDRPEEFNNK